MRKRGRITKAEILLDRLPTNRPLEGAEVGVLKGVVSEKLLKARDRLILHLVDLWAVSPRVEYAATGDALSNPDVPWEAYYAEVVARVKPFGDRVIFHRKDSVEATADIPDGSLDFVFIDGDHSYNGCSRDIEAYLPKLKSGGLLSGHDYNPDRFPGVCRAVRECEVKLSVTAELAGRACWFIKLTGGTKQ